ncbi:DUF5597 domain-containing protein [Polymorphobacter fuscus]|uniref:GH35 family beta-galactosidase n=1 Tax=Sandarakinorhabdus fusca TaxID=1439888 RepID=UPI0016B03D9C|nr:DUF5597 domain-containing protein [Polymorphobacter fuscus]NJC08418.1 beta-galactosidase GanA [Polymorphobacter fuscus]
MIRALLLAAALSAPALADVPALRKQGTATQLIVGGKPLLILGGELGNSSASSAAYMAPHWPRLKAMHLNTVLAPVAWELIEPREGQYDWSSVDQMVKAARANDLKLVILWFGAWKNSMSTYVPAWVKRDQARFPRAQQPNGQGVDILSAMAPETLAADSRAYAALMAHLKATDGTDNTVVMVQVENEIGMLPVARDHGPLAEAAFRQPVPKQLIDYLVAHRATLVPEMQRMWADRGAPVEGSWEAVFGPGDAAAEVFTAWHYARFADALTAAGKAAYPLPMYVNVALNRPGREPGVGYPSGGPLPQLIDVWKAGAPSLDLIAPDIYFPNFVDIVGRYKRSDNPLFIPEANNADRADGPANAIYAIGKHDAIGFSPFSIESIDGGPNRLADTYAGLEQLAPAILAAQGLGRMSAFKPRALYDETVVAEPASETIGDYRFTVSFADIQKPVITPETGGYGGMIIQTGPEDYLIAGQGITVTFAPVGDGPPLAGIDSAYEGKFVDGRWVAGRLLNGDQTHQGRHIRLAPGPFQIQKIRLYRYR